MKINWHRNAWGALLAGISGQRAWAAEGVTSLVAEPSASAWADTGLWLAIAAVGLLAVLVAGWLLLSRGGPVSAAPSQAQGTVAVPGAAQVAAALGYSERNVGNDASARPWERHGPGLDTGTAAGSQGGLMIGSPLPQWPAQGVPVDFDVAGFLKASKANFVALQEAWDRSDIGSLRAMMTDGMLEQIKSQLADREQSHRGAASATEVVMLEAHLLGIEEKDEDYVASVEFAGILREDLSAGPNPFREVWSIARPKSGGGWLVAGVQALQ
jgi:predicted lipid-binding transport protein (Tim44 family)